jgi:TP901 family phage tail tape measure protein
MTRAAITGDATREAQEAALLSVRNLARESATSTAKVVAGLDATVAAGRNLKEGMEFLPAIVKTGVAANAEFSDMAKTAVSIQDNLKIGAEHMQAAFDALVHGGKMGQFEAKDMARYLPSHMPLASLLGMRGQKGLEEYIAMMQTIRKGTGTSEEAAGAARNIFSKFESEKTIKGLAEMLGPLGMNVAKVEKEFDDARKAGKNLVWVLVDLIDKATKGDYSKIGKIIDDQEFKTGVVALLQFRGEYKRMLGDMKNATGSVLQDHARVMKDTQSTLDRMTESASRFSAAVGQSIIQPLGPVLEARSKDFNSLAEGLERANKAAQDAKSGGVFSEIFNEVAKGWGAHSKEQEANNQRISDERTLARMGSRGITDNPEARGLQSTIGMLENLPSRSPAQEAALKKHKARLAQFSGPVTPNAEELSALSRQIGRATSGIYSGPNFDLVREWAHHRQDRAPVFSGPMSGLPVPPMRQNRPFSFGDMPLNALDDAASKATEVKTTLEETVNAARAPGPALAASVKTGVDQAIADIERLNSAMRNVSIPGIGRGFPTGRSMSEVE